MAERRETLNTENISRKSLELHDFYRGKMETAIKCRVKDFSDFALWYTPGVAEPCRAIASDEKLSYRYTNRANTVAIVSDGSRVLGLGNIGPEAAMPVLEGKALLFKYLGGVDAVPIALGTQDTDEIIGCVKALEPSFGGINLEDIESPKCFEILKRLKEECSIPVWHDDQQGTAAVTLAGLIGALEVVGKRISGIRIAMLGAGASNIRIAALIMKAGADPGKIVICDSRGILHEGRDDIRQKNPQKWELCCITNGKNIEGGAAEAVENSDVLIALSAPGPGTVKNEWIERMASDAVVFVCANPVPEIWPADAKKAGARIVATGRSDFPNQINNSLGFPAIFRGALDVGASSITDEMCIAAAGELAACARENGLNEDYIIPKMDEPEVFEREAVAVALKAVEQGVASIRLDRDELYRRAAEVIKRARKQTSLMVEKGIIGSGSK